MLVCVCNNYKNKVLVMYYLFFRRFCDLKGFIKIILILMRDDMSIFLGLVNILIMYVLMVF